MSRQNSLLARNVVVACHSKWMRADSMGFNLTASYYSEGCPFHEKCPRKPEPPDESCFEAILAWMDEPDPASELGPGEMRVVDAPRPDTPEDEIVAACNHYSGLLQKLALAVPLPGSPSYAECVDEAIRIIKEWNGV